MSNPTSVIPLESNPEIFSDFAHKLGLSPLLSFHDVYSISDPDLLLMLPRPIYAIILLFPITSEFERERKEQDEASKYEDNKDDIKWFPQVIRNSCGFYALLHALSNISTNLILQNSLLDNFLTDLKEGSTNVTKLVEGLIFNTNNLYQQFSTQGQTEAPPLESSVELHFITFIKKDGNIYELDGRRKSFLKLGKETQEGVDIIEEPIIKEKILHYVELADEKNKLNFSMIGMGPSFD